MKDIYTTCDRVEEDKNGRPMVVNRRITRSANKYSRDYVEHKKNIDAMMAEKVDNLAKV